MLSYWRLSFFLFFFRLGGGGFNNSQYGNDGGFGGGGGGFGAGGGYGDNAGYGLGGGGFLPDGTNDNSINQGGGDKKVPVPFSCTIATLCQVFVLLGSWTEPGSCSRNDRRNQTKYDWIN